MANKIMNARIAHKHDVEENWLKAVNFVPLQGEIIIYDVDDTHSYQRLKIGDGQTVVSSLPFINLDKLLESGIASESTTIGVDNLAGGKAFNILHIAHADGYGYYDLDSVEGLTADDIYSVHLVYQDNSAAQYENVGIILDVIPELNRIIVDIMPPTPTQGYKYLTDPSEYLDENGVDSEKNTFRIVSKPLVGTRTIGCVTNAIGYNNKATSKGAVAHGGKDNLSYGSWSHTINKGNKAGYCADAGGNSTEATGNCSFTRGSNVKVKGFASAGIGNSLESEGSYSVLFGQNQKSTGKHSFGYGYGNEIKGNTSGAGGTLNGVSSENSFIIGQSNNIETGANWSFAGGFDCDITSTQSFVYGYKAKARATLSTVFGRETESDAKFSLTGGYGSKNKSNAACSISFGEYTETDGQTAVALGSWTKALKDYSAAFGYATTANASYQFVRGKYNIIDNDNLYLDIVGNGTSSTRSNAYTLDKNGNAWFAGDVTVGTKGQLALQSDVDSLQTNLENNVDSINMHIGALYTQIGDIETALTDLHTYAQSLIGGEGA